MNEIAPASRRGVKVGKDQQHVMQIGRSSDQDNPLVPAHLECGVLTGT